jgi:hypothetical protein
VKRRRQSLPVILPLLLVLQPARVFCAGAGLDDVIQQIRSEVKPQEAMEHMRRVYSTDRWFTFPKFQETAEYLERTMKAIGLRDVEILAAPADGVSQFGYWIMPLAWDVKQARLEIVEPGTPTEFRVLADYQQVPASLGMWSGPTPPGGVVAEVIELKSTSPAEIQKLDLKGKLVLTRRSPADIKWLLARKGALGAINASSENPSLRDARQWINSWGDNGWAFTKDSAPLLCFSITPRQAEFLEKLLRDNATVRVKATVDSRYYSGTYPYATGVLRGAGAGEEVLALGHTSEQGAHDNATGVAAMLESLATLNRLIAAGKLPRPQRSIRILAMGELHASMHYIATHSERIRRTVAAICLDTPAGSYELPGTEYSFYLNPDVARSYTDALILRVAESYFPKLDPPRPWHSKPYMTGTDTYLSDPMIGVPTVWPFSGSGVHVHHMSADTPDRVDARSLRDLIVVTAAYLYYVAAAGEPEARWLAEIALARGREQVQRAKPDHIAYEVDRQSQAVLSVLRLVPAGRREAVRGALDPLVEKLRQMSTAPPAAEPEMEAAARIVVKRKRFGTLPLDEMPPDRREGYPSGAWSLVPITALYWCDGQRNLAEVIRLTRLEHGPTNLDFVGYFRFLEKHGYVELIDAVRRND